MTVIAATGAHQGATERWAEGATRYRDALFDAVVAAEGLKPEKRLELMEKAAWTQGFVEGSLAHGRFDRARDADDAIEWGVTAAKEVVGRAGPAGTGVSTGLTVLQQADVVDFSQHYEDAFTGAANLRIATYQGLVVALGHAGANRGEFTMPAPAASFDARHDAVNEWFSPLVGKNPDDRSATGLDAAWKAYAGAFDGAALFDTGFDKTPEDDESSP